MTRFMIALALAGGLVAVGCAAGEAAPGKPGDADVSEDDATEDEEDDGFDGTPAKGEDDDGIGAPTPAPETPDRGGASKAPTDPEPEPEPTEPAPPSIHTQKCTSNKDGHSSVTSLSWEVVGAEVKIVKLAVLVTNKDSRNKNDVDVYVTVPGASEKKLFNSGDILPSGQETTVKWPAGNALPEGSKVRISTNFDSSFTDPWAACTIGM
jgi:hypothetical protein